MAKRTTRARTGRAHNANNATFTQTRKKNREQNGRKTEKKNHAKI